MFWAGSSRSPHERIRGRARGSAGAAAGLAAYRPELRPRVLLSDPLLDGAATVHLIKDTGSGNSFKVGRRNTS